MESRTVQLWRFPKPLAALCAIVSAGTWTESRKGAGGNKYLHAIMRIKESRDKML